MPIFDRVEIGRVAQRHGFARDTFEKVLRLKEILRFLNEDAQNEHRVPLISTKTGTFFSFLFV